MDMLISLMDFLFWGAKVHVWCVLWALSYRAIHRICIDSSGYFSIHQDNIVFAVCVRADFFFFLVFPILVQIVQMIVMVSVEIKHVCKCKTIQSTWAIHLYESDAIWNFAPNERYTSLHPTFVYSHFIYFIIQFVVIHCNNTSFIMLFGSVALCFGVFSVWNSIYYHK